jgi:MFS family permease
MILLVGAAVALYWSSLYLYVPTLPVFAREKVGDLARVGVILSMYGLWQAVVRLPLGILTDWLGRRKPFILLGFALAALGAWMMFSVDGYDGLVAGRAITGLAAAAWVPLTALFSSLFPPAEAVRATALLTLINSLSRVLSTSITGSLNDAGGYGLAFYLAVGVAGLAVIAMLPVREAVRAPRRPSARGIGVLVTRRDVLLPALLSAVAQYISWATTFGFLPVLAKNLGGSGETNSLLVSLYLAVGMLGNLLIAGFVKRIGKPRLLYASFFATALGMAVAALAPTLGGIFLAQVILGLGFGVTYPLCMGMSIEHVDEAERATAMGLHQAVYAIGMFAGPWLSGILAEQMGIQPMFGITGAAALALSLGLARFLREN